MGKREAMTTPEILEALATIRALAQAALNGSIAPKLVARQVYQLASQALDIEMEEE